MTMRAGLLFLVLAGCGTKGSSTTPTPASPLVGTWADELHTARLRADHLAELETRHQCPRLPCASAATTFGTWTEQSVTFGSDPSVTYALRLDGGDVVELTPPSGDALHLRRQPELQLAGTTWEADGRRWTFTADGFERTEPCADCADPVARASGTWSYAEGSLTIEYEGANEGFAVLVEGDELILVDSTSTIRYHRVK